MAALLSQYASYVPFNRVHFKLLKGWIKYFLILVENYRNLMVQLADLYYLRYFRAAAIYVF